MTASRLFRQDLWGTVVGPAIDEPLARIVVRWDSASPTGTPPEREAHSDDVRLMIAGGFRRGETVLAAKDLRVKGIVVVAWFCKPKSRIVVSLRFLRFNMILQVQTVSF